MGHPAKRIVSLLVILAALLLPGRQDPAADITPNSEFGENGIVLAEVGSGFAGTEAIALQPDGKIVVAGSSDSGIDGDIVVLRYLPDGTQDPDFLFSAGSLIGVDFGDDIAMGLVINPDGTLLIGGTLDESGDTSGFLARLLADGQLDYSFGDGGIVEFDGGVNSVFNDIILQSNNQIVAVGSVEVDDTTRPLVVRFESDGLLDSTFGIDGIIADTEVEAVFNGVAIQADGMIVAGGYRLNQESRRGLHTARYLSDGSLDDSFAETGRVSVFEDAEEILVHDVGIQPDGKVVVVGEAIASGDVSAMLIGRIQGDGSPDTSLSVNGLLVYDIGSQSSAYGVTVLGNGLILATGYRTGTGGKDMVILRYDAANPEPEGSDEEGETSVSISGLEVNQGPFVMSDGPLYRTIDAADLITTTISGSDEAGKAIAVSSEGTVYTAGSSGSTEEASLLLASYTETTEVTTLSGAEEPVSSEFYAIETLPITDITRTSALTGGEITVLKSEDADCVEECQEACEDAETEPEETEETEEELACEEECEIACAIPIVEQRGVVFSVEPNPELEEVEDGDDGTDPVTDPVTDPDTDSGTDDGTDGETDGETDGNTDPDNPLAQDKLFDWDLDSWLVPYGSTDDGEGVGTFESEILEVNPQTVYYVRAYAVLSTGEILYGGQRQFRTNDSCFIATAAFGTIDDFAVRALRQFRDHYLLPYDWGRMFVQAYYHFSPPLADLVADSTLLRSLVMTALLPFVVIALFMLHVPLALQYLLACMAGARIWSIRQGSQE